MELIPRKCLKCGTEIITKGQEIKPNWVQYFFKLSTGNNLCVAFCKSCNITNSDFAEIEKALNYPKDKKIKGIFKIQTAKELCFERQNERCFICGEVIGDIKNAELSAGGFIRHYICPMPGGHSEDPNHTKGKNARHYRELNKRRQERTGV